MGKLSRDKGKRGEVEVANWLCSHGIEARRGQQHRGGPDSPDVLAELPGWHIEVKRVERFRLYASLSQAVSEAPTGSRPVVFHRKNKKRWVAIMDAEDWLELVCKAREATRG